MTSKLEKMIPIAPIAIRGRKLLARSTKKTFIPIAIGTKCREKSGSMATRLQPQKPVFFCFLCYEM